MQVGRNLFRQPRGSEPEKASIPVVLDVGFHPPVLRVSALLSSALLPSFVNGQLGKEQGDGSGEVLGA